MTVTEIINDPTAQWDREPPASPKAIDRLIAESGFELPKEYLTLPRYSNGGEGTLNVEPGWFQLWSAEEVLQLNKDYGIEEFVPGFFGFGSDGGGELLAFDTRHSSSWKVVMIPFIPMEERELKVISEDFSAFIRAMGRGAENLEQFNNAN